MEHFQDSSCVPTVKRFPPESKLKFPEKGLILNAFDFISVVNVCNFYA